MDTTTWLASASADAERRGLPALIRLLETLARSTSALRAADDERRREADGETAGLRQGTS